MCQLLLRRTQNRWLTATCMCVCLAKMWTEEWQDHPAPEVKHKGDQTTRNWAVLQLFYRVLRSVSLHYTECFLVKTLQYRDVCMSRTTCMLVCFQVLQCLHFPSALKGSSLTGIHLHRTCEGMVSQTNWEDGHLFCTLVMLVFFQRLRTKLWCRPDVKEQYSVPQTQAVLSLCIWQIYNIK